MRILIDLSPLRDKLFGLRYNRLIIVEFADIIDMFLTYPRFYGNCIGGPEDVLMEYISMNTPVEFLEENHRMVSDGIEAFRTDLESLLQYHFGDKYSTLQFERIVDDSALFCTKHSSNHYP